MKSQKQYLSLNQYSRPGIKMESVKGIVIHYVGNPGSTALGNRNYFESLKNQNTRYASSHYIIGLEGEVIECVPETEVAYHASGANRDHIGIEVCHHLADGKLSTVTYKVLIEIILDICKRYKLDPMKDVIRHYDVTGKDCPRYYVQHPDAWKQLKVEVANKLTGDDEVKKIKIKLNGKIKEVHAINKEGNNYVKLQNLADDKIEIGYDEKEKLPIIKA
ncbi:MAG: N-acetylmuramoyl-L-alanine amidase family protein [Cellulosilyticaceae bacterium]